MQVFGLPGHIIRNARGASRLLAAQTPTIEAARRRDALARWRKAMAQGLTSEQAARAVGFPRSTLYRWRKRAEPLSRWPRRLRQPRRPEGLAGAVERLRLDHPMWGKEKLGPILRKQGYATSNATVGRIIGALIRRGTVQPVPALIRKVAARTAPRKRPHAIRKPKGVTFEKPGDVVQIDTLSIYPLPGVSIKHFNAYDPFAKWTVARPCKRATAKNAAEFLDAVLKQMPDPSKPSRSTEAPSSWPSSSRPAPPKTSPSMSCRPDRPSSTGPSSAATGPGAMSSMPAPTCQCESTKSPKWSRPSNTSITTTDPTQPLQEKPQPSTSLSAEPTKLPRPTCPEPGQGLDVRRGPS